MSINKVDMQVIDDKLLVDAILDDKVPAEAEALRCVLVQPCPLPLSLLFLLILCPVRVPIAPGQNQSAPWPMPVSTSCNSSRPTAPN